MRNAVLTTAGAVLLLLAGPAARAAEAGGTGPYPAVMIEEASLPEHTVYRPQNLEPFKRRHRLPVVVWGNGGCANTGNAAAPFLTEIASHGYLVIASGPIRPPPAPGTSRPALSRTQQLLDAIAWATAQAAQRDGTYGGHVDAGRVAVMGTSCGGLQAIEASIDPRITTTLLWSSGLLDQPREGANATLEHLRRLHGPILYVSGGDGDMASGPSKKDFGNINGVPVFHGDNAGAAHGGTINKPNGGAWAPVGVAWLDWQLKGQREAAKLFRGADCGLCKAAGWTVEKKKID